MAENNSITVNRRDLLTKTVPACAAACFGLCKLPGIAAMVQEPDPQDQHKFDIPRDMSMTSKQRVGMQYSQMFAFLKTMQSKLGEAELIKLMNIYSEENGQQVGANQRQNSADSSFQTYVATFRPPRYAGSLTHEVVEDSEKVFELRVTECIWATVFREAELDGEIGHATVCNMDYFWPTAFNSDFKMERDRTLMQGHDHCNHRYIDTT